MGGKQLYIVPGKSNEEINYELPLAGAVSSDIGKFVRDISGMMGNVKELVTKFDNATDNLNKVLLNVNDIVGDQNVKSDLKSTLSNIAVTSRNLNVLVAENKNTLKELTHKIGNTVDNVNGLVGETSPNLQNTFKDVQALTSRVDTLIGNLNLIVSDVQSQKSGVGKFMHDDRFFDNLNKTLEEIQTLSKKIRKDGVKINLF
jgi:ABC-type transporter Mla subunit MlaD